MLPVTWLQIFLYLDTNFLHFNLQTLREVILSSLFEVRNFRVIIIFVKISKLYYFQLFYLTAYKMLPAYWLQNL